MASGRRNEKIAKIYRKYFEGKVDLTECGANVEVPEKCRYSTRDKRIIHISRCNILLKSVVIQRPIPTL